MKRATALAAIIVVGLILTACIPAPVAGVVTSKSILPDTYRTLVPCDLSNPECVAVVQHTPAEYRLDVFDGRWLHSLVVDNKTFWDYRVGDYYKEGDE